MKFLNKIDGADKVITTDAQQFISKAEKDKLTGIQAGALNNPHPATHPYSMITGTPTSLPADGGNAATVGGFTVGVSVPASAKFTDTTYGVATTSTNGLMSGTDKTNLNSNTSARHSHTNRTTLDKITEVDGELRYNGETVVTKTVFTWAKLKGIMSWGELIGL